VSTTDPQIREAFHKKLLKSHHECSSTIVVDELGLAHGRNRIDIAVLNGHIHGYEIKSSRDNLKRFSAQLDEYTRSLQKLTVVVAPNHLDEVMEIVPNWCGVTLADKGPRGAIHFSQIQRAKINPSLEPLALAHLLWRKEAIDLLEFKGVTGRVLSMPRKGLYEEIVQKVTTAELVKWIKLKFRARETWRVGQL
jgi:hypothetical protein